MKMYRSIPICFRIEQVEVERESENSVWIHGLCNRKTTDYWCYHATFEEARARLVRDAEEKVKRISTKLEDAKLQLKEVMALKDGKSL